MWKYSKEYHLSNGTRLKVRFEYKSVIIARCPVVTKNEDEASLIYRLQETTISMPINLRELIKEFIRDALGREMTYRELALSAKDNIDTWSRKNGLDPHEVFEIVLSAARDHDSQLQYLGEYFADVVRY